MRPRLLERDPELGLGGVEGYVRVLGDFFEGLTVGQTDGEPRLGGGEPEQRLERQRLQRCWRLGVRDDE